MAVQSGLGPRVARLQREHMQARQFCIDLAELIKGADAAVADREDLARQVRMLSGELLLLADPSSSAWLRLGVGPYEPRLGLRRLTRGIGQPATISPSTESMLTPRPSK
jgi:hypothetical protein